MADATEESTDTTESIVTDEMKEAAKASNEARNKARETKDVTTGVGVLRKGGRSRRTVLEESDIPYPEGIHGKDFEFYSPTGLASHIPDGTPIADTASDQEFMILEEKIKHLLFEKPGRNLPQKRLYTIKAIHKDGRLVQLPFEAQIQNNAGGDPEDAIGLRRYQRKGIYILIDWDTLLPVYCASWDCWARAQEGTAFCSERHGKHTMPNRYKDAQGMNSGLFGEGATTARTWQV